MASTAARRSPRTSVRSLASMATSVPVPMAMPRSAWARAAASLTPSPTIATTRPAPAAADDVDLVRGQHVGDRRRRRRCRPSAATGSAARRLSPVSSTGRRPEPAQLGDRRRARRLHGVGDDERRRGPRRPSRRRPASARPPRRRRRPPQRRRRARCPVGEEASAPGDDVVAVDDAADAEARACCAKPSTAARSMAGSAGAVGDRRGDRVLATRARATPATAQQLVARRCRGGRTTSTRLIAPGRHGAGLVEHDRVDARGSTRAPRDP